MKRTRSIGALALIAAVGMVACDQQETPEEGGEAPGATEQVMPQQQMDPQSAQHLMEIQTIQQQLQPIQQRALQDEELSNQLAAIQDRVEAAMREEDPEAVERMDALSAEMSDAQAAGDQERMQELMMEAQMVQQEMQALQATVFERPDIREAVEAFEAAHRARMVEIDPQADSLLNRMDELIAELSAQAQ